MLPRRSQAVRLCDLFADSRFLPRIGLFNEWPLYRRKRKSLSLMSGLCQKQTSRAGAKVGYGVPEQDDLEAPTKGQSGLRMLFALHR
jgi:hypothetical protein